MASSPEIRDTSSDVQMGIFRFNNEIDKLNIDSFLEEESLGSRAIAIFFFKNY